MMETLGTEKILSDVLQKDARKEKRAQRPKYIKPAPVRRGKQRASSHRPSWTHEV